MRIGTIANKVKELEGFEIEILDEGNVEFSFDYKRAAPAKLTVSQWARQRMPDDVEVVVYDACGRGVHGRTTLNTVRQTYDPQND